MTGFSLDSKCTSNNNNSNNTNNMSKVTLSCTCLIYQDSDVVTINNTSVLD